MRQHCVIRISVFTALLGIALLSAASADEDDANDPLSAEAIAPENMESLKRTLGGSYFVDKELAQKAASLKSELRELKTKILAGDVSATIATAELDGLALQLEETLERIEDQKVLVSAFNVYTQQEETVIPTEGCRLLILQGDAVKLRGWEGPGIKCVVEKIIVAKEQPDDSEFGAIRVKHDLAESEVVGQTKEEVEQAEREFAEKNPDLTPDQRAARKSFIDSIVASNAKYEPFQGKACHSIELEGLKKGNENLSIKITSPGGGGTHSSQWKRHAKLTVFIPEMEHICVRGCQVKLDIQDLRTNLLLTTSGSRDRDYDGSFVVKNVAGDIVIDQAPVRELVDVQGSVTMTATDEFVNSGTNHSEMRTVYFDETAKTQVRNIDGDFTARLLRTKLFVEQVSGKLDILNDVGDTVLEAGFAASPELKHRIVSDCGKIEIRAPLQKLKAAQVHAYTRCGRIRTNVRQDFLEGTDFSKGSPRIGWRGLVPPSKERFDLGRFDRPAAALEDAERKPGIDLITKAGEVLVLSDEPEL